MKLSADELKKLLPNLRINERGGDLTGECPFCREKSFGISINRDGNPYGCFRKKHCGESGTIYTLLKFLGKLSDYLEERNYNKKQISVIERALKTKDDVDISIEDGRLPLSFKRIYKDDYLEERGFTDKEFQKHEVGIALLDPRLGKNYRVFLVRRDGDYKAYVARHIWDKDRIDANNQRFKETGLGKLIPRYRNDPNAEFSKLLYGYDKITENTKQVIVVEGLFDADNIDRVLELDDQEEIKCVASFGASLSDEQIKLLQLKGITSVVLLYEADVLEKVKKEGVSIKNEFESVLMGHWQGDRDPGDFDIDDLEEVFSRLITPTQYRTEKVKFDLR